MAYHFVQVFDASKLGRNASGCDFRPAIDRACLEASADCGRCGGSERISYFVNILHTSYANVKLTPDIMAFPHPPGLLPSEVAFICEMEMVTIVPRQRLERLDLLGVR